MIATGQIIANPQSGNTGVVLNVREIAQTADGSILAEYEAIELHRQTSNDKTLSPYAIAGEDGDRVRPRIVDPRTLTEAQAVAGGISRSEYREARENSEQQNGVAGTTSNGADLDPEQETIVTQLQARDSAVRQEERAHAAAAGPYGSAPQYDYQIGPDGKAYAIGGHVDVSVSLSGDTTDRDRALATLQNAALAPNAPSGADMAAFRQASLLRATSGNTEQATNPRESGDQIPHSGNDTRQRISIAV